MQELRITLPRPYRTDELEGALARTVQAQAQCPWKPADDRTSAGGYLGMGESSAVTLGQSSCQAAGNIRLLRADRGTSFKHGSAYKQVIVETYTYSGKRCACHIDMKLSDDEVFNTFVALFKRELGIE